MITHLLPLTERKEISEGTMSFAFSISGTDFSHKPGQFARFTIINPPETDDEGNTRNFSIASSPNKEKIMIAMRMRPSAFKNSLKKIPLGTKISVSNAMGRFLLDESMPAVFIAGGIGITPFRSIIENATENKLKTKITLLYSNKNAASAAFLDELEKWAGQNPNFRLIATMTREEGSKYLSGRIDTEMIKNNIKNIRESRFYIAGPVAMVEESESILKEMGIAKDKIVTEEFTGY